MVSMSSQWGHCHCCCCCITDTIAAVTVLQHCGGGIAGGIADSLVYHAMCVYAKGESGSAPTNKDEATYV